MLSEDEILKASLELGSSDLSESEKAIKEQILHQHLSRIKLTKMQLASGESLASPVKTKSQLHKSIITVSKDMAEKYFNNKEFMDKVKDSAKEEFVVQDKLEKLAE